MSGCAETTDKTGICSPLLKSSQCVLEFSVVKTQRLHLDFSVLYSILIYGNYICESQLSSLFQTDLD